MNEAFAPEAPSRATSPLNLRWLLISAALLPAAIAGIDYAVFWRIVNDPDLTLEVCLQFGWYVVQVGLIGFVVGRGDTPPLLRWFVFGWALLLINLLTMTLAMNPANWSSASDLPPAALFAGQLGLCVVWAIFGGSRWQERWPAMIVVSAGIAGLWMAMGNSYRHEMWTELMVLQVITLAVLCGVMRWRGFRLQRIEAPIDAIGSAGQQSLQFGIRHVLVWTTALAVLLGLGKALDLLTWQTAQQLARDGMFWKLAVATTSAIVIIVALWVALGRGHWLVRIVLGLVFTLLAGTALAAWSIHNATVIAAGGWRRRNWELLAWYEVGWWWLGWLFLSGGLLAATLIILRTRGYRLVRARPSVPIRVAQR